MFVSLRRLLVALIVFALSVMLRSRTMSLRGVLVMLGGFRVSFLRHICSNARKTARPAASAIGERRHSGKVAL
jgi:hypothetical protein